ncbi:uncharacterized protein BP5553_04904 [Venustampulla echinocandica]|uniref:Uncharacterized protein n=1 Tax=Venustampulla echinocandica TaxID=2656787 RepID=A0A370TPL1_9HELO|nr:uncharacterized protein BP5553_04904 [Venustampulla echinocandica]RDL37471.1 hypothetical protein BP5553_04904 [Venustampulla echinocandica]
MFLRRTRALDAARKHIERIKKGAAVRQPANSFCRPAFLSRSRAVAARPRTRFSGAFVSAPAPRVPATTTAAIPSSGGVSPSRIPTPPKSTRRWKPLRKAQAGRARGQVTATRQLRSCLRSSQANATALRRSKRVHFENDAVTTVVVRFFEPEDGLGDRVINRTSESCAPDYTERGELRSWTANGLTYWQREDANWMGPDTAGSFGPDGPPRCPYCLYNQNAGNFMTTDYVDEVMDSLSKEEFCAQWWIDCDTLRCEEHEKG